MNTQRKRTVKACCFLVIVLLLCVGIYFIGPPCLINYITGFYCPACGTQRMLDSILRLDFVSAIKYNCLMFFLLPLLSAYAIVDLIRYIKGKELFIQSRSGKLTLAYTAIIALLFMILRNIPAFGFLAPQ